ncbi:ACP phosphodiesterase, partial [Escherichia coli]|nr:ACP phosphodiesterase [Escherichia coli]
GSFDDFLLQYDALETIFFQFYPQMMANALQHFFVQTVTINTKE